MKVLMLGWELPPHNSGGLGVACLNLAKRLAVSGADIEFILPFTAEYNVDFMRVTGAAEVPDDEMMISAYGSNGSSNFVRQEKAYINKVLDVVGERSFDVIHANDWLTFRAALRAKERTGWPLIAHVHSVESDRSGGHPNPVVKDIEQLTFLLADRIVAVSERTRQSIMHDYNIPKDKISVVHNSIDLNDLEPTDLANSYYYLEYLKSKGYKVVCNLGRQTLQKGLPNLLHAAQQVVKLEPKTIFLLVGDGDQQSELIELAAELDISRNVLFAGFQRGQQVRDAFGIADLFVMPSISEPFGLTTLEAIGYGTPTLISKQSGVAEILHHSLKVDFWDVNQMVDQIVAVVRSQTLRDSLIANSQAEIESLSWQQSADKILGIYKGVEKALA